MMVSLAKNDPLMKFIILLLPILSFSNSYSQYSEEFDKYSMLYPKNKAVSLEESYEISIEFDGNDIIITEDQNTETLYLDATAKYNSKGAISYSSFFDIEDIEANVSNYNGKKYKTEKVKDFTIKDNLNGSFYDDIKTINFIYPNLKKGSKSRLKYRTIIKNPRFLKTIYLGDYSPIIHKKVTMYVDKGIVLNFKEFNLDSVDFTFEKFTDNKHNIYSWEIKEVKEFKYNRKAMSYRSKVPHIIPIISKFTLKNKEYNVLNNEKGLYDWYFSLVKNLNTEKDAYQFKSLVDSLTKDCNTDLEKVKTIYYWTQQNIKYIAFEDGLGGFIPRSASEVYKKKYGDCKDNSSILQAMLQSIGLDGRITWVGTRKIPYKYHDVPTPIVDNHMILTYFDIDSTLYFLDATGRYLDLKIPSSFIQGKETLISLDSSNYMIKTVPVVPASSNIEIDSCNITLNSNAVEGSGKSTYNGYLKTSLFSYLEGKNKKEDLEVFYKKKLEKGNNNFMVDSISELNKFKYDKPFFVNYSFEIPNYAKSTKSDIYINLNLDQSVSDLKPEKDEVEELEHKFKTKRVLYLELEIPSGYNLNYLPEDIVLSNKLFTASITYRKQKNKIIYNQEIILNFIKLNPQEVVEFRTFINKIEKAHKEVVILSKN